MRNIQNASKEANNDSIKDLPNGDNNDINDTDNNERERREGDR